MLPLVYVDLIKLEYTDSICYVHSPKPPAEIRPATLASVWPPITADTLPAEGEHHEDGDPPRTRSMPVRVTLVNSLSTATSTSAATGANDEARFTTFTGGYRHELDLPLVGAETAAITEMLSPLSFPTRFVYYDPNVTRHTQGMLAKRTNYS